MAENDGRERPIKVSKRLRNPSPDIRSGAHFRRIVDNAVALGLDPLFEVPLGQLRLHKVITDAMLAVGDWIGRTERRWAHYQGLKRFTHSPALEVGQPAHDGDVIPIEWQRNYHQAKCDSDLLRDLLRSYPPAAVELTLSLCVDNVYVGFPEIQDVRSVLAGVAFELEQQRKRRRKGAVVTLQPRRKRARHAWRSDGAKPTDTTLKPEEKN